MPIFIYPVLLIIAIILHITTQKTSKNSFVPNIINSIQNDDIVFLDHNSKKIIVNKNNLKELKKTKGVIVKDYVDPKTLKTTLKKTNFSQLKLDYFLKDYNSAINIASLDVLVVDIKDFDVKKINFPSKLEYLVLQQQKLNDISLKHITQKIKNPLTIKTKDTKLKINSNDFKTIQDLTPISNNINIPNLDLYFDKENLPIVIKDNHYDPTMLKQTEKLEIINPKTLTTSKNLKSLKTLTTSKTNTFLNDFPNLKKIIIKQYNNLDDTCKLINSFLAINEDDKSVTIQQNFPNDGLVKAIKNANSKNIKLTIKDLEWNGLPVKQLSNVLKKDQSLSLQDYNYNYTITNNNNFSVIQNINLLEHNNIDIKINKKPIFVSKENVFFSPKWDIQQVQEIELINKQQENVFIEEMPQFFKDAKRVILNNISVNLNGITNINKIFFNNMKVKEIINTLKTTPNKTKVVIDGCPDINKHFLKALNSLIQIERIDLKNIKKPIILPEQELNYALYVNNQWARQLFDLDSKEISKNLIDNIKLNFPLLLKEKDDNYMAPMKQIEDIETIRLITNNNLDIQSLDMLTNLKKIIVSVSDKSQDNNQDSNQNNNHKLSNDNPGTLDNEQDFSDNDQELTPNLPVDIFKLNIKELVLDNVKLSESLKVIKSSVINLKLKNIKEIGFLKNIQANNLRVLEVKRNCDIDKQVVELVENLNLKRFVYNDYVADVDKFSTITLPQVNWKYIIKPENSFLILKKEFNKELERNEDSLVELSNYESESSNIPKASFKVKNYITRDEDWKMIPNTHNGIMDHVKKIIVQ